MVITKNYEVGHLVVACCEVIDDFESAERLVFLLFRLLRHPDPEEDRQRIFSSEKKGITSDDIRHDAINCVRGVSAGAAMTLCTRFLEMDLKLPELLFPLLRHYARDHVLAVRAALLYGLPYLTYKHHTLGWQLFQDIFREQQIHLWPLAERQLYYEYNRNFDKVSPCLDRIREEALNEAGGTWGRITALSHLSGHVTQDSLFDKLEEMNNPNAWKGVAEVFVANLDQHQHEELCIQGLSLLIEKNEVDNGMLKIVGQAFAPGKSGRLLDIHFAIRFIRAMKFDDYGNNFSGLVKWIADLAGRDSIAALEVCECLMNKLEAGVATTYYLFEAEPLVVALANILREADETDDEKMIHRAVRLQDQFLRMDISGMENFFEEAGKL